MCDTVREVLVPKRAVHLGEHAAKNKKKEQKKANKSVKCQVFEAHSAMNLKAAFSVSRHVLKGAESEAVNLTQGVV